MNQDSKRAGCALRSLYMISLVVLLGMAFVLGFLTARYGWTPRWMKETIRGADAVPPGMWNTMRTANVGDMSGIASDEEAMEALAAIGYMGGVEEAGPFAQAGVTVYHQSAVQPGWNLYCSGHAPEAILMDMHGEVRHTWRHPLPTLWRYTTDQREFPDGMVFWRRVLLLPSGDLLAIFEGIGMIRITRDSELVWASRCAAHHDIALTPDGHILTLTRKVVRPEPAGESPTLVDDFVTWLDIDTGEVLREVSLAQSFRNSSFAPMLEYAPGGGDVFHTNSIELLAPGTSHAHPAFAPGNILLSIRHLHAAAVLDPEAQSIVWLATGMWLMQHEARLLESGRVLIFDNRGHGGVSRILEFDPATLAVQWEYGRNIYSRDLGAADRLPNGNTLIVESNNGRVIEVTPDQQIVWEFITPHRAGEAKEFVAAIPDLIRLTPGEVPWLE